MRALALGADVIVVRQPRLADHVHRGPRRRRGVRDRLARVPGRARGAAGRARAGRLPGVGAAGHARRLGPPARAAWRFPGRRSAAARSTAARLPRELGRGPARAAASSTRSTTSRAARRCRSVGYQALPVPGKLALGPSSELELHPADGPHRRRHRVPGRLARRAGLRRLPVAGRDPDGSPREARSTPTWRRWSGCGARRSSAQTVVPGHGGPSRPSGRSRSSSEDAAYLDALAHEGARGAAARRPAHGRPARDPRAQCGAGDRYSRRPS